jgi:hypothetical protein
MNNEKIAENLQHIIQKLWEYAFPIIWQNRLRTYIPYIMSKQFVFAVRRAIKVSESIQTPNKLLHAPNLLPMRSYTSLGSLVKRYLWIGTVDELS